MANEHAPAVHSSAMDLLVLLLLCLPLAQKPATPADLGGAWVSDAGNTRTVWLLQDGYFTATTFNDTAFLHGRGGPYHMHGSTLVVNEEFNTAANGPGQDTIAYNLQRGVLLADRKRFTPSGAPGELSGVWRITQREQNGKMEKVQHTGSRKTLKMLSGDRFQWFAIDPDGNQFHGTGGGTYSFTKGRYTEHIEFFSRDPKRVGASLSFEGNVENGKWHHAGPGSKGDPISEVWERVEGK